MIDRKVLFPHFKDKARDKALVYIYHSIRCDRLSSEHTF